MSKWTSWNWVASPGKWVKVVRGRKVPIGTVGMVCCDVSNTFGLRLIVIVTREFELHRVRRAYLEPIE